MKKDFNNFRWQNTELLNYKDAGSHFKDITRQILFEGADDAAFQLRYFEMQSGGHSTLEKHQHVHVVIIARGCGEVLIGSEIKDCRVNDVIVIESGIWHQFRATKNEAFGFYCLVNCGRDKPHRPDEKEAAELKSLPLAGGWIRL